MLLGDGKRLFAEGTIPRGLRLVDTTTSSTGVMINTYERHGELNSAPWGLSNSKRRRRFLFPGGIPSHVAAAVPGYIHERDELGYSLMHAYGAAFDDPHVFVLYVVGDGEAETGSPATSWLSNVFLNPTRDCSELPVLHLNGCKIANPTVLDRIPQEDLLSLMRGFGHDPIAVSARTRRACNRSSPPPLTGRWMPSSSSSVVPVRRAEPSVHNGRC